MRLVVINTTKGAFDFHAKEGAFDFHAKEGAFWLAATTTRVCLAVNTTTRVRLAVNTTTRGAFGLSYNPKGRSTRLTPPAPVPTVDNADEMILQDTLQHLPSERIEKMVDEPETVIDDSPIPRNDDQNILGTRLEPRSDKERPEVEITNVVIPVNVKEEEEEITDEVYELKRMEKGKIVEESRNTPSPTPIRYPRIHTDLISSDTKKLQELTEVMVESLPTMVDKHIKEQVEKQVPKQVKVQFPVYVTKGLLLERQQNKEETDKMIAKAMLQERRRLQAKISSQIQQVIDNNIPSLVDAFDDPHDNAPPKGENSIKWQKISEYEAHVTAESFRQVNESEQSPSSSSNQEHVDDYDFWTESYASDDDETPTKCTSGDEHQYHIDQMKNFLKSDIRDPEAPALSLINQDLLYLKKGNSGPEKIVLSLHKFPAIIFNDVDIEERTSRWVNKCVKKFNPYARYGVEHWKNPHAKIFYIKRQKEPGKPKEVVYLNSKIIQVIKTYWELGHEHKFITEIVARRANECIVSITESDYKNLNKNDIEDMYLLIMNGKVPDYAETGLLWSLSVFIRSLVIWERVHDFQLGIESYQQKVNLTAPTISFPGIEEHKMFSIIYEPVHGIIYKNSKKEKRVMRHSEIHKFCDATLNRVLEGLKSYNNDVKYGYIQRDLTEDEVEYLKLFEEEIEVRLKYRNQMRRWEIPNSQLQALVDRKKVIITEASIRRDLQLEYAEGTDCFPTATIFEELTRMRRKQRKDNEDPQLSGLTEPVTDETENVASVPTHSNDLLISGEDRLQLNELMDLCTKLQQRVLDLENAKTSQDSEIAKLKRRVKKLEKKKRSRTPVLTRLKKVGRTARIESSKDEGLGDQEGASKQERKIADMDTDTEVTLIDETQGRNDDNLMFDTGVLDEQEVKAKKVVSTAEVTTHSAITTTVDELTLAQTLIEIKAAKPKVREVMIQEPKENQIMYDQEVALKLQAQLQAEFEKEEKLAIQKEEEANIALIESWDNIQAKIDANYQMAQQLQAEEQEQLNIEEKSKLFEQLLEARKKHFAEMRVREKRNKPLTQAQQRKLYCNYLKNMEGYTLIQLKGFKFKVIKDMFDKAFKRVNNFVDYKTELMEESSIKAEAEKESSSKRAGEGLESNDSKKQKLDEKVEAELKDDKEKE
ncbi:hypothetical protein Tco_1284654 [Tanacetum coccineum]